MPFKGVKYQPVLMIMATLCLQLFRFSLSWVIHSMSCTATSSSLCLSLLVMLDSASSGCLWSPSISMLTSGLRISLAALGTLQPLWIYIFRTAQDGQLSTWPQIVASPLPAHLSAAFCLKLFSFSSAGARVLLSASTWARFCVGLDSSRWGGG